MATFAKNPIHPLPLSRRLTFADSVLEHAPRLFYSEFTNVLNVYGFSKCLPWARSMFLSWVETDRLTRANTQILRSPLFLSCRNIIVSRDALADLADFDRVSRSMRAQTDKAVPSGLTASPVWLTAYTEISRGIEERALFIQNHNRTTSWRNAEEGDRNFLCVSRTWDTYVAGSAGKLKYIAARRLSN